MELKKEKWLKKDIKEFEEYLKSLQNKEKQKWTQNIVRSNLKVLAIKNPILKQLANEIYKGNYESFLNYNLNNYYEEVLINAFIINKIKEPKLRIKYLEEYKKNEMCWATCDALKFDNNLEYLELSKKYTQSDEPYTVRLGIIILFAFIETNIDDIFEILKQINKDDYYINMAYSWLLCECYIKNKTKTIKYIEENEINNFVINKMISKCHDSFRITQEEKENLKKCRKTNQK